MLCFLCKSTTKQVEAPCGKTRQKRFEPAVNRRVVGSSPIRGAFSSEHHRPQDWRRGSCRILQPEEWAEAAHDDITLDEVRRALSTISGSLSAAVGVESS